MKSLPLAFRALLFASAAYAQVVQWNFEKRILQGGLNRRSEAAIETDLQNNKQRGGYFVTVEIGSPGQELTLQLDTGSSDVWLPYRESRICNDGDADEDTCTLGSFDPSQSDSYELVGLHMFDISYIDDSYSRGDYFQDDIRIGNVVVHNLTMGLGRSSSISHGLAGIGYAQNEAYTDVADSTYPNLPIAMRQAGLINTVAYSLWLNDLDANTGNILFGGIDTAKFQGQLTIIDLLPDEATGNYTHFTVAMTSLEARSPSGSDILTSQELPFKVVLDSGTTLTYVPTDLASQAWEEVGAIWEPLFNFAVLPCSHWDHDGYFSFGLAGPDGPRINVTMDELVIDLTDGDPPRFESGPYSGEFVCQFGIQNASSGPYILGDTFLRSAYVVYDLINNQIALAPTDFNATETDITAFESRGAPIPSGTVAPSQNESEQPPQSSQSSFDAAEGFGNDMDNSVSPTHRVSSFSILILALATSLWLMVY